MSIKRLLVRQLIDSWELLFPQDQRKEAHGKSEMLRILASPASVIAAGKRDSTVGKGHDASGEQGCGDLRSRRLGRWRGGESVCTGRCESVSDWPQHKQG